MANAIDKQGSIPAEISSRLSALRRGLNLWLLVNGLARLLIATVLFVLADFLIDRFLEMDIAQRAILSVAIAVALLFICFWGLIRPFLFPTGDDALVLQVESKNKHLQESLISAVQFARGSNVESQGVSRAMVNETIRQGTEQAKSVPFNRVLNNDQFLLNLCLLLLSLGAIIFGIYQIVDQSSVFSIWFNRNVMLGSREKPKQTYLRFPEIGDNDRIVVARGENYALLVEIDPRSKKTDVEVFLDYDDAGESSTQSMRRKACASESDSNSSVDGPSKAIQETKSQGGVVPQDKAVDVKTDSDPIASPTGVSDDSAESAEQVVDGTNEGTIITGQMPQFERVFQNVASEFRFRARGGDAVTRWITVELVEPPAVTALSLEISQPEYTVTDPIKLEGSGPHSILKGSSLKLTANANKPLSQALLETPDGREIDLLTDGDQLRLAATIPAAELVAGKFRFLLIDTTGLKTSRPSSFDLKIRADRPPIVRASLNGISGMVVSRAIVPISATLRDDFSVTGAKLEYNWKGDSGDSVVQTGEIDFENYDESDYNVAELRIESEVDLEPLKIPAGAGLRFVISAFDNDNISGPNKGISTEFLLRVVTEDELRTDLLRREKEQRQEFERLLAEQDTLLGEAEAMAADSPEGIKDIERFYSEKRKDLIAFKRRQKVLGTNLSNVADRFQEFLTEALNNRLDDSTGTVQRRYRDGIISPTRDLCDVKIPVATLHLEQARRTVGGDDQTAWQTAIDDTVAQQKLIVEQMNQILLKMAKSESFQEAVQLLRQIEKAEGELMARVRKEKADRLKKILGDGGLDDEDSPDDEKPEDPAPENEQPE